MHAGGFCRRRAGRHCTYPSPLLRRSHKTRNRLYMGPPGTARVLQSGRDLMQATELRTPILIGVLCSPRARRVLMCAAS